MGDVNSNGDTFEEMLSKFDSTFEENEPPKK
jgi:hypothetical protein